MRTDFDTLKSLASYTLNFLKESQMVDFPVDKRLELADALAVELAVSFATDEDIRAQAIEEVEEKMGYDTIPDDITDTEMCNHARKEIIKSFSGENISGLHLVESLHQVGTRVKDFLMNSEMIEDVYGTDDEIIEFLIEKIRKFTIRRA